MLRRVMEDFSGARRGVLPVPHRVMAIGSTEGRLE